MKTKKRNPQDATLRNIRALKKRLDALEECVGYLLHLIILDAERECLMSKKKGK